jgi:hypothetical protein
VVDKFTKPHLTVERALQYARTDTYADLRTADLTVTPLGGGDSFKNILPIQAADFLAWEVRKVCEERKTFDPPEEMRTNNRRINEAVLAWEIEFEREHGRPPRSRRSAKMLSAWPPPRGYMWDLHMLNAAHASRHENGWSD